MKKYEYVTTTGIYEKNVTTQYRVRAGNPTQPETPGEWEMVGSAAADGCLFFFWRAEVNTTQELLESAGG